MNYRAHKQQRHKHMCPQVVEMSLFVIFDLFMCHSDNLDLQLFWNIGSLCNTENEQKIKRNELQINKKYN